MKKCANSTCSSVAREGEIQHMSKRNKTYTHAHTHTHTQSVFSYFGSRLLVDWGPFGGLPGAFRGAFGPLGLFVVWMRALLPCLTSSEAVLGARPVCADAVKQSRRRGSAYENVGQQREPLCRRPQAPWKYQDRIALHNGVQAQRAVGELRGPSEAKQRNLEKRTVFHQLFMDLLSFLGVRLKAS